MSEKTVPWRSGKCFADSKIMSSFSEQQSQLINDCNEAKQSEQMMHLKPAERKVDEGFRHSHCSHGSCVYSEEKSSGTVCEYRQTGKHMIASRMMQKGFIFIIVLWNLLPFAHGKHTEYLQLSLGCRAVIPCPRDRRDSHSFKWFYKKDQHRDEAMTLFSVTESRLKLYNKFTLGSQMKVLNNRSLVIEELTENNLGLYWCVNCFKSNCEPQRPSVYIQKKSIPKEIIQSVEVPEGSIFNYSCQGVNRLWTFDSENKIESNDYAQKFRSFFPTSNNSIYIVNVERTHAGKYICWTRECPGHRQRVLTINLCVISDTPREPKHQTWIYATSAVLMCLILMALLICCYRQRLRAAFPVCLSCGDFNYRVEEETSVIYSSVVIKGPVSTTSRTNSTHCVYSEIKHYHDKEKKESI
ncbi:uncharacterized protein V6R79_025265 [Siganus canaliculatus]